jgi:hypothetical protein
MKGARPAVTLGGLGHSVTGVWELASGIRQAAGADHLGHLNRERLERRHTLNGGLCEMQNVASDEVLGACGRGHRCHGDRKTVVELSSAGVG